MRRRVLMGSAAALLVVGVATGVLAERERLFGYHTYNDCIIHEVKNAGSNARLLAAVLKQECEDEVMRPLPWERYRQ